MPDLLTQVTLKTADDLSANFVTNSWSFATESSNYADLHDDLWTQYDLFRGRLSKSLAQNLHEINSYDRSDPTPRAPVLTTFHNFTSAITGNSSPSEVAMCLSFQGEKVSGTSQARRRGRIYLGPLAADGVASDGRPSSTLTTAVRTFGVNLLAGSGPSPATYLWTVWSTVDDGPVTVDNGWVDNAFDTQRRRGIQPTTRSTF